MCCVFAVINYSKDNLHQIKMPHCACSKITLSNIYFHLFLEASQLYMWNHMLSTCSKCQRGQRSRTTLTDKEKASDHSQNITNWWQMVQVHGNVWRWGWHQSVWMSRRWFCNEQLCLESALRRHNFLFTVVYVFTTFSLICVLQSCWSPEKW